MVSEEKTETIYNVKAAAKQTELINEVVALRGLVHEKEEEIQELRRELDEAGAAIDRLQVVAR